MTHSEGRQLLRMRGYVWSNIIILMFYKQGQKKQEMEVFLQHRLHEWPPPMSSVGRWRDNVQQQSTEVIDKINWSTSTAYEDCCIVHTGMFVPDVGVDTQRYLVYKGL